MENEWNEDMALGPVILYSIGRLLAHILYLSVWQLDNKECQDAWDFLLLPSPYF